MSAQLVWSLILAPVALWGLSVLFAICSGGGWDLTAGEADADGGGDGGGD